MLAAPPTTPFFFVSPNNLFKVLTETNLSNKQNTDLAHRCRKIVSIAFFIYLCLQSFINSHTCHSPYVSLTFAGMVLVLVKETLAHLFLQLSKEPQWAFCSLFKQPLPCVLYAHLQVTETSCMCFLCLSNEASDIKMPQQGISFS